MVLGLSGIGRVRVSWNGYRECGNGKEIPLIEVMLIIHASDEYILHWRWIRRKLLASNRS